MHFQNTIRDAIEYEGIEPYGGQRVRVRIEPARPDFGIVFKTKRGEVKSSLDNARVHKSAILLRQGNAGVLHVEHLLATLWAYEIDNANIYLEKNNPSKSFQFLKSLGLATHLEVVPNPKEREFTLCDLIEKKGIVSQNKERKLLKLKRKYSSPELTFEPINQDGLVLNVTTNYKIPGREEFEIEITPQNYRAQLSKARPYIKHLSSFIPLPLANIIASIVNPTFGIGHGFSPDAFFFPTKTLEEWRNQEKYPAEIARHSVDDRLGAIALLNGRLSNVRVKAHLSGHSNDLRVLNELERYYIQSN